MNDLGDGFFDPTEEYRTVGNSDFSGATFRGTDLIEVNFRNCNFQNSKFISIGESSDIGSFVDCDFTGAEIHPSLPDSQIFEEPNFINCILPNGVRYSGGIEGWEKFLELARSNVDSGGVPEAPTDGSFAPESVEGYLISFTIEDGNGLHGTYGVFQVECKRVTYELSAISGDVVDSAGNYSFTRVGDNSSKNSNVKFTDSEVGLSLSGTFSVIRKPEEGNVGNDDGGGIPVAPTPTEDPFTIPGLNLEMKPIPAGTFVMGSPSDEQDRDSDEGPQTRVTISKPFWLGKTEVTQAQWKAVMGNNPSYFKGDDLPVEEVSWTDAVAFCEKLNEMKRDTLPAGYHYTLPTEAQWEYACRAGTTTRFSYGNDTGYSQLGSYAWYDENSSSKIHPVGEKLPNRWGLHDMHGNVFEWCLDWYGEYPGGSITDPQGPQSGTSRVLRGGGWYVNARVCRSAVRLWFRPVSTYTLLGFRVALSSVPSE
jgi:formylglycine-generating enzyme required for sulfatase activity